MSNEDTEKTPNPRRRKILAGVAACLAVALAVHVAVISRDHPQKPFVSDGCSMFPDHWHYDCCYTHDKGYWDGGTPERRREVDAQFRQCVADISGEAWSWVMYYGVQAGGHPVWPTPWRWDFGRSYRFGYADAPPEGASEDADAEPEKEVAE